MTEIRATNITWHEGHVSREERSALLKQRGATIWFTGLSGSGKSTIAYTLEHALVQRGNLAYVLDGDNIRHGLNKNLGFSAADREENIRRIGEVAKLFADGGIITMTSFISPYRKDRDTVRALHVEGKLPFIRWAGDPRVLEFDKGVRSGTPAALWRAGTRRQGPGGAHPHRSAVRPPPAASGSAPR